MELFSTRAYDEIWVEEIAEEAGISRGLLYHYFGNKQDFHRAVVQRAADRLVEVTAPSEGGDPLDRLARSLAAYVDYVVDNYEGYRSLVRGAAAGNGALREIYEDARGTLTERIFDTAGQDGLREFGVTDTAAVRLLVRGWSAMTEEVVLSWVRDPRGVAKDDLLEMLAAALPGVLSGTLSTVT
jgi:AcrR family transcriptional regulator